MKGTDVADPLRSPAGEARTAIRLTETFAMMPAAAVSGLYFSHPEARYFQVGRIGADREPAAGAPTAVDVSPARRL